MPNFFLLDFYLDFSPTSRTLILPGMLFSIAMSRQCLRGELSSRPCSRLSCSRHALSFSTVCFSSEWRFPFSSRQQSRASNLTRPGSEGSGLGRGLSDSSCSPGMESLTPWEANFRCSLYIKPVWRELDKESEGADDADDAKGQMMQKRKWADNRKKSFADFIIWMDGLS